MRNPDWTNESQSRKASFKVSGALMDNNLVMFDVDTQSTWPQLYATANSGPRAGDCLELGRNAVATTWGFWKALHPDALAMSNQTQGKTGETKVPPEAYEVNPYADYHVGREPTPYPITRVDPRLPERTIVLGVHGKNGRAALLIHRPVGHVFVGETPVVCLSHLPSRTTFVFENALDGVERTFAEASAGPDGLPRFGDQESGSVWSIEGIALEGPLKGRRLAQVSALHLYWFAWATFFPGNPILRP